MKKGGKKNLIKAREIIRKDILNIESTKFVDNLFRQDLLLKFYDVQQNEAATKKFNESKLFLKSFE